MKLWLVAMVLSIPVWGQDIPDGPGKATVEKLCNNCHGLSSIVGLRHTKSEWETTVDEMVSRGLKANDEDLDAVVVYLARYLGKTNVNSATAQELQDVGGFSSSDAEAIVRYRADNGSFKDIADLRKVPNLDQKRLDEHRDRISFK